VSLDEKYTCEICRAEKGEENGWLMLYLDDSWAMDADALLIERRWHPEIAKQAHVKHVCGFSCTHKLVERYVLTGSLDAPRGAAADPVETKA
jgi:hypothetical protein